MGVRSTNDEDFVKMKPIHLLLLPLVLGACGTSLPAGGTPPLPVVAADSIVLERTRCYGFCPAYRVRLTPSGSVAFLSRYPNEGRTETGRILPADFRRLVESARAAGFFTLPDTVARDAELCPAPTTDSPTVTLAIFTAGRAKEVVDDRGCASHGATPSARLAALRTLVERVDTAAGVSRWVRVPTSR
ncbi:MAG TPA: DUF6438 domain-containing protein [Longimicrobium sp.]